MNNIKRLVCRDIRTAIDSYVCEHVDRQTQEQIFPRVSSIIWTSIPRRVCLLLLETVVKVDNK